MARKLLRDDQWQPIEYWLPGKPSDPGRSAADNRLFMEAVLWIAHTGAPWRDLPPERGPWNSVYKRFARWEARGVWQAVFEELTQDGDFKELYLDSHSHTRPPPCGRGGKKNGPQARGGVSTKIYALAGRMGSEGALLVNIGTEPWYHQSAGTD